MVIEPRLEMCVERFDLLFYDFLKRLRLNDDGDVRFVDIHLLIDRSELEQPLRFVHCIVHIQCHAVSMRVVRFNPIPDTLRLSINEQMLIHIAILDRFCERNGDRTAA